MKTNCPCGGLLIPSVAGRLSRLASPRQIVWFCAKGLSLSTMSLLVAVNVLLLFGWLTFCPPWLVPFIFWEGSDSLADGHCAVWLINQSMSWTACPSVSSRGRISRPSVRLMQSTQTCKRRLRWGFTLLDPLSVVSTATAPSWSLKSTSFG